jgi:hypothetical protein
MIYQRSLLSLLLICVWGTVAAAQQSAAGGDFTLTDHNGEKFRLADQRGALRSRFKHTDRVALMVEGVKGLFSNPHRRAAVEDVKRGHELLARIIAAMGGGQKIDGLTSYADVHKATAKLPQGDQVEADAVTVDSEFAINRKDFGIVYAGRTNDLIRDEVALKLTIKAQRPKLSQR